MIPMNLWEKAKNWKASGNILAEGMRRAKFKGGQDARKELQRVLDEIFEERMERNKQLKKLYLKAQRKKKDAKQARRKSRKGK